MKPILRLHLLAIGTLACASVVAQTKPTVHAVVDLGHQFTFYGDGRFHRQYLADQAGATSWGSLFKFDLSNANLSGAALVSTNFTYATLLNTNLTNASLTSANLTYATLYNTNLSGAALNSTNFTSAFFNGANLTGAYLNNTNTANAQWFNTICPNGTLTNTGCSAT